MLHGERAFPNGVHAASYPGPMPTNTKLPSDTCMQECQRPRQSKRAAGVIIDISCPYYKAISDKLHDVAPHAKSQSHFRVAGIRPHSAVPIRRMHSYTYTLVVSNDQDGSKVAVHVYGEACLQLAAGAHNAGSYTLPLNKPQIRYAEVNVKTKSARAVFESVRTSHGCIAGASSR